MGGRNPKKTPRILNIGVFYRPEEGATSFLSFRTKEGGGGYTELT